MYDRPGPAARWTEVNPACLSRRPRPRIVVPSVGEAFMIVLEGRAGMVTALAYANHDVFEVEALGQRRFRLFGSPFRQYAFPPPWGCLLYVGGLPAAGTRDAIFAWRENDSASVSAVDLHYPNGSFVGLSCD